jgi:hypothetical protein
MLPKKHLSGSQKRKKRKQDDWLIESQRGALRKFFQPSSNADLNEDQVQEPDEMQENDHNLNAEVQANENIGGDSMPEENLQPSSDHENLDEDEQEDYLLPIYDPRTRDNLDNRKRDILIEKGHILIEKGPIRELNLEFPKDDIGRHFSYAYYSRKLANDEVVDRKWLVYSKHMGKVYCFCCKLFKSNQSKSFLASDGLNDWKRLGERLKEHENSVEHLTNMNTWNEVRLRLSKNKTIDDDMQQAIANEKSALETDFGKNSFCCEVSCQT